MGGFRISGIGGSQRPGYDPDAEDRNLAEDMDRYSKTLGPPKNPQDALATISNSPKPKALVASKRVQMPDGGVAEFPGDMPDKDVEAAIAKSQPYLPPGYQTLKERTAASPEQPEPSLLDKASTYGREAALGAFGAVGLPETQTPITSAIKGLANVIPPRVTAPMTPDELRQPIHYPVTDLSERTTEELAHPIAKPEEFAHGVGTTAGLLGQVLATSPGLRGGVETLGRGVTGTALGGTGRLVEAAGKAASAVGDMPVAQIPLGYRTTRGLQTGGPLLESAGGKLREAGESALRSGLPEAPPREPLWSKIQAGEPAPVQSESQAASPTLEEFKAARAASKPEAAEPPATKYPIGVESRFKPKTLLDKIKDLPGGESGAVEDPSKFLHDYIARKYGKPIDIEGMNERGFLRADGKVIGDGTGVELDYSTGEDFSHDFISKDALKAYATKVGIKYEGAEDPVGELTRRTGLIRVADDPDGGLLVQIHDKAPTPQQNAAMARYIKNSDTEVTWDLTKDGKIVDSGSGGIGSYKRAVDKVYGNRLVDKIKEFPWEAKFDPDKIEKWMVEEYGKSSADDVEFKPGARFTGWLGPSGDLLRHAEGEKFAPGAVNIHSESAADVLRKFGADLNSEKFKNNPDARIDAMKDAGFIRYGYGGGGPQGSSFFVDSNVEPTDAQLRSIGKMSKEAYQRGVREIYDHNGDSADSFSNYKRLINPPESLGGNRLADKIKPESDPAKTAPALKEHTMWAKKYPRAVQAIHRSMEQTIQSSREYAIPIEDIVKSKSPGSKVWGDLVDDLVANFDVPRKTAEKMVTQEYLATKKYFNSLKTELAEPSPTSGQPRLVDKIKPK